MTISYLFCPPKAARHGNDSTFPQRKCGGSSGLTTQECEAVHAKAFVLINQGLASRVSVHDNGHYMCVFDGRGKQFFIGRVDDVYYLFDHNETLVAESKQFGSVLEALIERLTSTPDGAA